MRSKPENPFNIELFYPWNGYNFSLIFQCSVLVYKNESILTFSIVHNDILFLNFWTKEQVLEKFSEMRLLSCNVFCSFISKLLGIGYRNRIGITYPHQKEGASNLSKSDFNYVLMQSKRHVLEEVAWHRLLCPIAKKRKKSATKLIFWKICILNGLKMIMSSGINHGWH